jgi:hypothetical protein
MPPCCTVPQAQQPTWCPCFQHRTSQLVRTARSVSLPEADTGDSAFSLCFSFSFSFVFSGVGCSRGHTGQDPDRPRQALQAAQSQCTRPPPPATGPRTLAGCFCAEVLPGASSKPNLPAIKSIIKFDTAKRSPERLLPSRPSHSPVTALRRQPWLFSLTTYCSAAPRCRILPLTWISIWIDTCIITHHNEGLRLHHLDIR